jgi:hypothetical protein
MPQGGIAALKSATKKMSSNKLFIENPYVFSRYFMLKNMSRS